MTTTDAADATAQLDADADNFAWLLDDLVEATDGVHHALTLSSDGLLVAASAAIPRPAAERLAAVASGITSLADGVSRGFSLGDVEQVVVEMTGGYLFATAIGHGAALAVIAGPDANIGVVAYEMARFAGRAAPVLTPEVIDVLKARR